MSDLTDRLTTHGEFCSLDDKEPDVGLCCDCHVSLWGINGAETVKRLERENRLLRDAQHVACGLIPADQDGPLFDDWYELRRKITELVT